MTVTFSEAISRQPIRAFSIATFVICMLVLVADGMDAQLLGIVAPVVIGEFGVDKGTFGIAMSAALVGFGLGSWGGGWMGDAVGRRWALALAALIFALGTVGASTSADVWQMAVWRLVSGLGFGSAYANAIALAGEWLPDRWRSVGVTTLSVGTPAGGLVVASLAPTLLATYEWRGTFVAVGLSTLVVVLLIVLVLRDSPSFLLARGKADAAKVSARKVLDGDPELASERHMTDTASGSIGVLDPSNFRLNLGVGIAFAAATMVAYGMLNWGTTFLTAKGLTFETASYTVGVGGLTSMAASIVVGLVIQRLGSRSVILGLSIGLLVTLLVYTVVLESISGTPTSGQQSLVIVLYGLSGVFFSGAIASFYALMTYAYPASCRSAGIGFGIFIGRIGAIAATGLGGWLIDLGAGSLVPFFAVLCVGAVLISAAALIVDRPIPPSRAR